MEECEVFYLNYFLQNFKLPNLRGDFVGTLWYHQTCKTVFPEIFNKNLNNILICHSFIIISFHT